MEWHAQRFTAPGSVLGNAVEAELAEFGAIPVNLAPTGGEVREALQNFLNRQLQADWVPPGQEMLQAD